MTKTVAKYTQVNAKVVCQIQPTSFYKAWLRRWFVNGEGWNGLSIFNYWLNA